MIEIKELGLTFTSTEHLEAASEQFLEKLLLLVRLPKFHVNIRRGYPTCEVCGYSVASEILKRGLYEESVVLADVIVPWGKGFFVFPTLLHHYCKAHQFRVPMALSAAVGVLNPNNIDGQEMKGMFVKLKEASVT